MSEAWRASARNVGCLSVAYAMALSSATVVANMAPTIATASLGVSRHAAPSTVGALLLGSSASSWPGAWLMQAPAWGRKRVFLAATAVVAAGGGGGLGALRCGSFALLLAACFLIGSYRAPASSTASRRSVCAPWPGGRGRARHHGRLHGGFAGPAGAALARALFGARPPSRSPRRASSSSPRSTRSARSRFPVRFRARRQRRRRARAAVRARRARRHLPRGRGDDARATTMLRHGPDHARGRRRGLLVRARAACSPSTSSRCRAACVVGSLIERCGPLHVSFLGGGAFAASACVMLLGAPTLLAFAAGMGLCGLAWNLLFSSGTILLTTLYRPEDAIRIQGANDVVIFGVAGLGSCASGPLYERGGWPLVVGRAAARVEPSCSSGCTASSPAARSPAARAAEPRPPISTSPSTPTPRPNGPIAPAAARADYGRCAARRGSGAVVVVFLAAAVRSDMMHKTPRRRAGVDGSARFARCLRCGFWRRPRAGDRDAGRFADFAAARLRTGREGKTQQNLSLAKGPGDFNLRIQEGSKGFSGIAKPTRRRAPPSSAGRLFAALRRCRRSPRRGSPRRSGMATDDGSRTSTCRSRRRSSK